MRLSEYLPWVIATASTLFLVTAVMPERWSDHRKRAFKAVMAVVFFLLIGLYWLSTGEKFDETAYRLVFCNFYVFERCAVGEKIRTESAVSPQFASEVEALRKTAEDIKRQQREAEARRAQDEKDRAEKQRLADEERKREQAQAKAKADADAAVETLKQREAVGQVAIQNAFKYWRSRNFKVAAEYAEEALKVFAVLPSRNERHIRNMTAEAHMIVGFGLALLGASPKDKIHGCNRLQTARQIYAEIGNNPMVSRTDQDLVTGGCVAR